MIDKERNDQIYNVLQLIYFVFFFLILFSLSNGRLLVLRQKFVEELEETSPRDACIIYKAIAKQLTTRAIRR